ncbi:hypothetical protein L686_16065 [Stutzerimonas stutzeri MF28]|nr:hypothetical protein L686_16065 [Stutzerimonas stutzeri MF28]
MLEQQTRSFFNLCQSIPRGSNECGRKMEMVFTKKRAIAGRQLRSQDKSIGRLTAAHPAVERSLCTLSRQSRLIKRIEPSWLRASERLPIPKRLVAIGHHCATSRAASGQIRFDVDAPALGGSFRWKRKGSFNEGNHCHDQP